MDDLKYIKKHYGEKFAHICRNLFPSLLEQEGLLSGIIEEHFAHSRNLGEVIDNGANLAAFKNYIYDCAVINEEKKTDATPEDVIRMFDEAGYILYPECQTEAEVQAFRHYYDRLGHGQTPEYVKGIQPERWAGEELCTFNGGRLDSCRVWFAVKKEVAQNKFAISRSEHPERQDEYGTSVISIQWSKLGNSTLSIKNRYNHSVKNPDATFGNNLDNIHMGLQNAFCSAFGIKHEENTNSLQIDDFVLGNDGKHYLLNLEFLGVRYCDNNVVIFPNGEVKQYAPERYIVMDGYIVDLKDKKLLEIDPIFDSLRKVRNFDFDIDKISLTKENDDRKLSFVLKDGTIVNLTLDKRNIVRKMDSPNMVNMPDYFLNILNNLTEISFESLQTMGKNCFICENSLIYLNLPNITTIEPKCFMEVDSLHSLDLPKNNFIGRDCFYRSKSLTSVNLPMNTSIDKHCFWYSYSLTSLNLPNNTTIDRNSFCFVESLTSLNLPNNTSMGDECFKCSPSLISVSLPSNTYLGFSCFKEACSLTSVNIPKNITIELECFENSPIYELILNGERVINYDATETTNNDLINLHSNNSTSEGDDGKIQ